eukprot:5051520-Amphidinium_carterae.1
MPTAYAAILHTSFEGIPIEANPFKALTKPPPDKLDVATEAADGATPFNQCQRCCQMLHSTSQ